MKDLHDRCVDAMRRAFRAESLLKRLVDHMEAWGKDEDGIPESVYDDWKAAKNLMEGLK